MGMHRQRGKLCRDTRRLKKLYWKRKWFCPIVSRDKICSKIQSAAVRMSQAENCRVLSKWSTACNGMNSSLCADKFFVGGTEIASRESVSVLYNCCVKRAFSRWIVKDFIWSPSIRSCRLEGFRHKKQLRNKTCWWTSGRTYHRKSSFSYIKCFIII